MLLVRAWMGQHNAAATGQWRTGWSWYKTDNGGRKVNNWQRLPSVLEAAVARLRQVQIECRPALTVIAMSDTPKTLFYVDPPYPAETRSKWSKTSYRHEMSEADHRELARALHAIRGKAVVSSYHGLYDELYRDWRLVEMETQTDGRATRRRRVEVLYLSPNCDVAYF